MRQSFRIDRSRDPSFDTKLRVTAGVACVVPTSGYAADMENRPLVRSSARPWTSLLVATFCTAANLVGQNPCVGVLDFTGPDIPLINGYAVDVTLHSSLARNGVGCGPCTFNWDVEVEITTPVPMIPGSLSLCAFSWPGGSFSCGDPGSSVTLAPGWPPFIYTFRSVANDFVIPCGGSLALSLEWNPGLGYITVAELVLKCTNNGC